MAKDFAVNTDMVYGGLHQAASGKQIEASPEEQAERRATMQTQGKAGCKLKRINMAFSDPNYNFLRIASRASGQSLTQFVNMIVDQYRESHPDLEAKMNAFLNELEGL